MNPEKLKLLQEQVRIGGKGTQRRKKKIVHHATATDDKKLQGTLKKLGVNVIPGIEEVNLFKDDGNVIHFNNPKVQASLGSNTFAITGHAETKTMPEMFPSILSHLGLEHLSNLRKFTSGFAEHEGPHGDTSDKAALHDDEDEVPDLVENFDEASKTEVV